jgi:hypothetical protein
MIAAPPPGRGRWLHGAGVVGAFAAPGTIVWAAIGAALAVLPLQGGARWAAVAFGLTLGLAQVWSGRWRAPSSAWQVPSSWVRHRHAWVNTLVWGALLGPGLITRNPYGSIWMLALLLASLDSIAAAGVVGAAAGLLQGSARAHGVLREVRAAEPSDYLHLLLRQARWRAMDGAALIAAAALVATLR